MRPSVVDNGDGTVDVLGHPIWSVGRFYGHGSPKEGDVFDRATLDRIAADMQEVAEEVNPRLYAGHPLHPILKMLARPKGKLRNFRREGDYLVADFLRVPKGFWQQIERDQARFSPDMAVGWRSTRTGKSYPWVVTGLGVLGRFARQHRAASGGRGAALFRPCLCRGRGAPATPSGRSG